jgi:ATP-dependent protease ClpP protease subunit
MPKKIFLNYDEDDLDDSLSNDENNDLVYCEKVTIKHWYVNIDEDINEPQCYRKVFRLLKEANEYDEIHFLINTFGGVVSSFIQLYNDLMETKAKTIAHVYTAYSAGAFIALSCDQIIIQEFGSMMLHLLSGGSSGKISEMASNSDFLKRWSKKIIANLCKGFLSDDEINSILNGSDLWFTDDELFKKLKKWVPFRERKKK